MNHEQINPFDNEAYAFLVLINSEEQYSLWPDIRPVPAGWQVVMGPESRVACEHYIETHWLDIRPRSARQALA
jgi:MbtH protein